ncbi:hypothetical protein PoB_003150100 [Plakobranchus ocellatus]|uniref:Reverse transcriptase domain-containing protein n=1 Tax=Plakobranchus ocellatus TaxID=259542 RepID=A0AAV4AEC5_9GAST|nr:hypothetical protein PoB_003150100 [Plakobranchus ocellatus]
MSRTRPLADGLPQRSALSCTMFLIFMNNIGNAVPTRTRLSYADTEVEKATEAINMDNAGESRRRQSRRFAQALLRTSLEKLGRVQNAALRFVLRVLRSTPIAILELAAGCEPLGLRRCEYTVLAQEKYLRTSEGAPLKSMVEEFVTQRRRIKKALVLSVAHDLLAKYGVPTDRVLFPSHHYPPDGYGIYFLWPDGSRIRICGPLKETKCS